jgi:hypothetical protein
MASTNTLSSSMSPMASKSLQNWKIELVAIPVTDVDRAKAVRVEQAGSTRTATTTSTTRSGSSR